MGPLGWHSLGGSPDVKLLNFRRALYYVSCGGTTGIAMISYQVRLGSLTVIARGAGDAVELVDKLSEDLGKGQRVQVCTMEGKPVDIDALREIVQALKKAG